MQLFRNRIDRHAVVLIDFRQGHQDLPLRTADARALAPKISQLFKMDAYRGDHPGKSPDGVLIFTGGAARLRALRWVWWAQASLVYFHNSS